MKLHTKEQAPKEGEAPRKPESKPMPQVSTPGVAQPRGFSRKRLRCVACLAVACALTPLSAVLSVDANPAGLPVLPHGVQGGV